MKKKTEIKNLSTYDNYIDTKFIPQDILDTEILNIQGNSWTIRDACTGCMVFGMTGSGKSSGPMKTIAEKLLNCQLGGVVFCAKKDEKEVWENYAKKTSRSNDLIFLSNESFNYLEHENSRASSGSGQIENLVNLYMEIVNIGKPIRNYSSNDDFWQSAVRQMLRNAMTLLQLAEEKICIDNVHKIIISSPTATRPKVLGYCNDLLTLIGSSKLKDSRDFQIAQEYFLEEFCHLDERTRSNIISTFSGTADALQRGELARCFGAKKSTLTLEDIYRKGKILIVDYDVKSWGKIGQYAAGIIKYCFQMMIERREDISSQTARPVFLWADECQFFAIENDQKFQTTARSSRTISVFATQNLGNLFDGYGKDKAYSLLGNLGAKFFCQNGEFETNEWASKSIGREIICRKSRNIGDSKSSTLKGDNTKSISYSESISEHKDYRLDPGEFSTLKTGGPRWNCKVEFIFWQSGRVLIDGNVFVKSSIAQECTKICGAKYLRDCPNDENNVNKKSKGYIFLPGDFIYPLLFVLSLLLPIYSYKLITEGNDIIFYQFDEEIQFTCATAGFFFISITTDFAWSTLKRFGKILLTLLTGHLRYKTKTIYGMIYQEAVWGYYFLSMVLAIILQYNLGNNQRTFIILLIWFCLCGLFRFVRFTGNREINKEELKI